jgi:hypothetical protein
VTLVRIGWNGAAVTPPLISEIVAPERLSAGVTCIGHPAAESGVGEALRATARALAAASVPFSCLVSTNTPRRGSRIAVWQSIRASASAPV